MTAWQNEAEDLDVKMATHVKAKSAVEAPKGEASPMGKLRAEVMKLLNTLKTGNVMKGNKVSGNPGAQLTPLSLSYCGHDNH